MLQRLSQVCRYIFILLVFISCQKQVVKESVGDNILGVWKEIGYQHKIEIKDSSIVQIVGFPLITGDRITYFRTENILKCKYYSQIIGYDSFDLEIIAHTHDLLKFRKIDYPLEYEIIFEKK